ncbi:MAG: type IX secretion system membrane protein PorP/SprF [Ichthyobacteriaceae bacterium]|nr:type IX secretion system membrane protein PorP/SprF [Ichthyobacteriaceae bacterium]
MKNKNILLSVVILMIATIAKSQNIDSRQYLFRKNLVNMAAMVENIDFSVSGYSYKDWEEDNSSPLSVGLDAVQQFTDGNYLGTSFNMNSVAGGAIVDYDLSFSYANKIRFKRKQDNKRGHFLSLGFSLSWRYFIIDNKVFNSEDSQNSASIDQKAGNIGSKFGAYYYVNGFYSGISFPNLMKNNPINSNDKFTSYQQLLVNSLVGYDWIINRDFNLDANIYMRAYDTRKLDAEINAIMTYNNFISAGLSVQTNGNFSFITQFIISDNWRLGLSSEVKFQDTYMKLTHNYDFMLTYNLPTPSITSGSKKF